VGFLILHPLTMTSPAALADEFGRATAEMTSFTASNDQTSPRDNTTLVNNERPDIPHPAYGRMRPRWEKCAPSWPGQKPMRAAGETYLPRLEAES
jgi:hypothetical protein